MVFLKLSIVYTPPQPVGEFRVCQNKHLNYDSAYFMQRLASLEAALGGDTVHTAALGS